MRKRGEITVFLSLTLICILSLFMGLLESARTAGARLYLNMAANSAMASVMSQYNRNLWEMYRLLYLEYESEAAIIKSFESYLDFYLEQENFYPMKNRKTEITTLVTMPENGGKTMEDEILSYVKYRLPDIAADAVGISKEMSEASRAGNFRTLFEVCKDAGKKTRRLEKARSSLEAALENMEKLRKNGVEAAGKEKERSFEDNAKKLLKKIGQFPGLVDKYEDEIQKISAHRKEASEQENGEETDSEAAGNMRLELAAYGNVEEAAEEQLLEYRKMEVSLRDSREALEEAIQLLDSGQDGGESGEEGTDWDGIREYMELVEIPEVRKSGVIDKEKSDALDRLEDILGGNWLELVVPEGTDISKRKAPLKDSLSQNAAAAGDGEDRNLIEEFLMNEYAFLYFDSFLGRCEGREPLNDQTLLYEQEYLLCGNAADEENLKETAEQLLMIRGAMNLFYLMGSLEKKAQADELALAVSGGNAPVQFILSFFILTLWALGEAVWDVRCLLDGGRVPFWKNEGTWKLSLNGLLSLDFLNGKAETVTGGSSYKDYLRILFFLKDRQIRNYRMMDIIQWNVRKKQNDFSIADCAFQVEVSAEVVQRHVFLLKSEYIKTVDAAWSY